MFSKEHIGERIWLLIYWTFASINVTRSDTLISLLLPSSISVANSSSIAIISSITSKESMPNSSNFVPPLIDTGSHSIFFAMIAITLSNTMISISFLLVIYLAGSDGIAPVTNVINRKHWLNRRRRQSIKARNRV